LLGTETITRVGTEVGILVQSTMTAEVYEIVITWLDGMLTAQAPGMTYGLYQIDGTTTVLGTETIDYSGRLTILEGATLWMKNDGTELGTLCLSTTTAPTKLLSETYFEVGMFST
jgi:hypothetical protein